MGRVYTASFGGIAVTAIQDIFEVVAPADAIVNILELYLGQTSDVGDAAEEILRLQFTMGHTTSGSGGAAITARPHELGDAAFGGAVERNNTTQALGGSPIVRVERDFNVRVGLGYIPIPKAVQVLSPSMRFVLELPSAPGDSLTMNGSITIEEVGG